MFSPPPPPPLAVWAAPRVARGYSYPVVPPHEVPGARRKLSHIRLLLLAGGALVIIVVLITLIAVLARPISRACGLFCGPHTGTRLVSMATYTNQRWGYTVEYDSSVFTIGNQDDNGAEFDSSNGDGSVLFTASSGSDLSGANQNAFNALPSASFQGMQSIGPVRGAEIGLVNGQGTAYSGQFAAADGSGASPIGATIFSASQNNVTITVTAFSGAAMDNSDQPYGLDMGEKFDYLVTQLLWKGQ